MKNSECSAPLKVISSSEPSGIDILKEKNLKYMIIHPYLSNFHHNIRKNAQKYKLSLFMAIESHCVSLNDHLFYKKGQILVKISKKV